MARKASVETEAQKAFKAAQEAVKAAKDKADKQDNQANRNALEGAKTKLNQTSKAVNRERFITLGGLRVRNVIQALDILSQCANRKSYDFGDQDVAKAMKAINDKIKIVTDTFTAALHSPAGEKPADETGFQF